FGLQSGDKVLKNFSARLSDFAQKNSGVAYRGAFNQFALLVEAKNKDRFLCSLQPLLEELESLEIKKLDALYAYEFVLLTGIYFLSSENDGDTDFDNIFDYLNGEVIASNARGEESFVIFSGEDRPNWTLFRTLETEVPAAWKNNEFVPYYQPAFDTNTGRMIGSEILARWEHPTRGILRPAQFIPILENQGLIIDLDLYMIEEACKKIQSWLDNGILTVPLAVNLSNLNVHRDDFVERLVGLVKKYDIPPVLLELELPERNLMFEENAVFVEKMNELHRRGFSLSLDNFGAKDISALGLLKKVPFDIIRMDSSFFEGGDKSTMVSSYIRSFLNFAKELDIKVVVEHIETAEELELVKSFGCTNCKGYYFSKPIPNEKFQEIIQ
ncbi:MAG: EAL domain-containing protein, partial [Oscillospiraceae bacterium]